jgi:CRP/FNR family transcriptional regulator, cyclic AMP receptor protein
MMEVLHREQTSSNLFVRYLLARTSTTKRIWLTRLFNSSEKRLARILPNMSQESPAEMAGTTRSRISFFISSESVALRAHRWRCPARS